MKLGECRTRERTERAQSLERLELKSQVREAVARAELAEEAARRAEGECTVWAPLAGALRASATRMSGAVHGAKEHVFEASKVLAKETGDAMSTLAKETPGKLSRASSELGAAARLLFTSSATSQNRSK